MRELPPYVYGRECGENEKVLPLEQVLAIQKQAYEDGLRDAGKDRELIEWLAKNLDWDGQAYWLPELCIKERNLGGPDFVDEPTPNEVRSAMLTASQKEQQ